MNKLFAILIILIVAFIYNYKCNTETFKTTTSEKNSSGTSSDIGKEVIRTGRDPYDDNVFADIITFNNDPIINGKLGIEKCIEQCKGKCVEFGMTGIGYCFPKN